MPSCHVLVHPVCPWLRTPKHSHTAPACPLPHLTCPMHVKLSLSHPTQSPSVSIFSHPSSFQQLFSHAHLKSGWICEWGAISFSFSSLQSHFGNWTDWDSQYFKLGGEVYGVIAGSVQKLVWSQHSGLHHMHPEKRIRACVWFVELQGGRSLFRKVSGVVETCEWKSGLEVMWKHNRSDFQRGLNILLGLVFHKHYCCSVYHLQDLCFVQSFISQDIQRALRVIPTASSSSSTLTLLTIRPLTN